MSSKKYFIAVVLPEPLLSKIEALKQGLFEQHDLKGALRSPAHITLHRPFEWKEEKESKLIEKLQQFQFKSAFSIVLNNYAFFEPRVVYVNVLPNLILYELHAQLTQFAKSELKLYNEAEDLRGFHPHVTIAFRDLKKSVFYQLKEKFSAEKIEGSFPYQGFTLLKLNQKWDTCYTFV